MIAVILWGICGEYTLYRMLSRLTVELGGDIYHFCIPGLFGRTKFNFLVVILFGESYVKFPIIFIASVTGPPSDPRGAQPEYQDRGSPAAVLG